MALLIIKLASPGIPGSKTENEAFFANFSDPVLKQNALRYNPVLKQNAKWPGKQPKKKYYNNWRVQRPQNIINKPGLLDRFLKKKN